MKTPCSLLVLALMLAMVPAQAATSSAGPVALKTTDTLIGSGRLAIHGNTVAVHYGAWLYAPSAPKQRGAGFDTSARGAPFSFTLGAGRVIKGWDEGVRGMRVGGKRTLVVPSAMAFGQAGRGAVPPGANLIFDIDLVDVK
jgi:FKBP-type peptidyl-prolyl cis-trans isomerase FkpA